MVVMVVVTVVVVMVLRKGRGREQEGERKYNKLLHALIVAIYVQQNVCKT